MMLKNLSRVAVVSVVLASALAMVGLSSCTKKSALDPTNTLYTSSIAKIKGIDPAFSDDMYSGIEVTRVYEGLLQYHYLKRPYELIPALSDGMPKISAGGKTITFKIKKGVRFQDDACFKATEGKGRELVADDVIFSFKRLADPKLNSPMWWLLDGKVVGLNEWRDAQAKAAKVDYAAAVPGLKAVDSHTLQITLKNRSFQFLYALAMPAAGIVAREAVEAYGPEFLNHPVGTGAFKLTEYNPTSKIVYVKNPTYRQELYPSEGEAGDKEKGLLADAGKSVPFVDKVVVSIMEQDQPRWLTFMQGGLDTAGIPKDSYDTTVDANKVLKPEFVKKGMRLDILPSLDLTRFTLNMADPLIGKNKYLRQAISLALDFDETIRLMYNGRALNAQGPIPPGLAGYDPNFKNPYKQHSVEKAKELMAKAGYPDGKGLPPIEFLSLADSTARQFAELEAKHLAKIGIQLKVLTSSWPEFQQSIKNRRGQAWSWAWGADYPDAENFLQLWYSKNQSPGPNDASYSNPEFDRLYEKSLTLPDSPARTELYKKMSAILVEDVPAVFGTHRLIFSISHSWLKNFKPHEFNHGMSKYYRVDSEARKNAKL